MNINTSRRQGRSREGRLKEAGSKTMSRRTEIAYKAQPLGKSAQHDESLGLGGRVNAAVV